MSACVYCREPFDATNYGTRKTKDHIVPRSFSIKGTPAGRGNVVECCGRCNGLKASMLPSQMRALADEHENRRDLLRQLANRAEELITERKLLP